MKPATVAIVGGGAAGLATAIFLRRAAPDVRVILFEGARRPGAKILVSGGSRCNVTNVVVTEADYNGGKPTIIRRVLRRLPVSETVSFFRSIGVALHEEDYGKLFPDSNKSRDVLEALLRETARTGAELRCGERVLSIDRRTGPQRGFDITTASATMSCDAVVLASGGLSLPKTGSDGAGYQFARRLGHSIVQTTPALAPLVFDSSAAPWHANLSGVALPTRLRVTAAGRSGETIEGPMLWTHFGISGPAALDVSRHWLRARIDGATPGLEANLLRDTFEHAESAWLTTAAHRPTQAVENALARLVPAAVASAANAFAGIPSGCTLAQLTRDARRRLLHALTALPLPVIDSRGYNYAEATAGGVSLSEIDPGTMASRTTAGLFLVGEVLDVDGRLGGFNFQWAWASAFTAAHGIRAMLTESALEGPGKA